MKLSEMMNAGPPTNNLNVTIAPYLLRNCPEVVTSLYIAAKMKGVDCDTFATSFLAGMDTLVRYLQMYGLPDDTGQILEESAL